MKDDFAKFLNNITVKTKKAVMATSKAKKTVIVHPSVWKDEKEAKKANSDWNYREIASSEKELLRAMKGK